ncbi:hypothetical protein ABK905_15235 [Acerihabitans sp. KWT182]|uniref:Uncharacterized protein n=1 Tax=Acerihabitans sp. KWT182 TaxID=3157919 RepID=A0AAU7Q5A9_9GAMM
MTGKAPAAHFTSCGPNSGRAPAARSLPVDFALYRCPGKKSAQQLLEIMNNPSGLPGIRGFSHDGHDIVNAIAWMTKRISAMTDFQRDGAPVASAVILGRENRWRPAALCGPVWRKRKEVRYDG